MSKDIERQVEEQAKVWSGIAPPNAASRDFARGLAEAVQGFERTRGELVFEDEPSSFEAALQETKERTPCSGQGALLGAQAFDTGPGRRCGAQGRGVLGGPHRGGARGFQGRRPDN